MSAKKKGRGKLVNPQEVSLKLDELEIKLNEIGDSL